MSNFENTQNIESQDILKNLSECTSADEALNLMQNRVENNLEKAEWLFAAKEWCKFLLEKNSEECTPKITSILDKYLQTTTA